MRHAEKWYPVKGYEESYEVSNLGKVRSKTRRDSAGRLHKGQLLKLIFIKNKESGHVIDIRVRLRKDGISKECSTRDLLIVSMPRELWNTVDVSMICKNPRKYGHVVVRRK